MKTYKFTNYRTGEMSAPITANSLVEAQNIIGIGHKLFSITK